MHLHPCLLDHLGRLQQDLGRNRQAERVGGFQVDCQHEFPRLLDGKITRLGTLEDLVYVNSGAPLQFGKIRPVRHQAASLHTCPPCENCRQPAFGRKVHNLQSVVTQKWAPENEKALGTLLSHRRKRTVDIVISCDR